MKIIGCSCNFSLKPINWKLCPIHTSAWSECQRGPASLEVSMKVGIWHLRAEVILLAARWKMMINMGYKKKKGNSKQGKSQECQTGFKQGKLFALNSKLLGMSDNSPYLEGNLRSRRTWAFEVVEGKMAHETYTSTKRMIMFNYVQLCWIYGLLSDIAQSLELKAQTCASLKSRGGQLAFIDHPCRRTHRRTLRIWKASKGYNYIDM